MFTLTLDLWQVVLRTAIVYIAVLAGWLVCACLGSARWANLRHSISS